MSSEVELINPSNSIYQQARRLIYRIRRAAARKRGYKSLETLKIEAHKGDCLAVSIEGYMDQNRFENALVRLSKGRLTKQGQSFSKNIKPVGRIIGSYSHGEEVEREEGKLERKPSPAALAVATMHPLPRYEPGK